MSCFKIIPFKINDQIYWDAEKILPVPDYSAYYVNLMNRADPQSSKMESSISRRILPKIDAMLEWGVVKVGDVIVAKGRTDEAILQANGNVLVGDKELSMQVWLKNIYGWSSIQTYVFAVHKESGKTLSTIREEFMSKQASEVVE